MDLWEHLRDYQTVEVNGTTAFIDRSFEDDIAVKLPCGYLQRFWHDLTDEEAIKRTIRMKDEGIESS